MILFNILLNSISQDLKTRIIDFIKSLHNDFASSSDEWDHFAVKILYTLFDIED